MANDFLFRYNAKLNRVIDGDTFEMIVDHGFKIYSLKTVRLARCNTPETKGREKQAGKWVSSRVKDWLTSAGEIVIHSSKIQKTFDRYVFELIFDGQNLTDELLFRGFAWKTDETGKLIGRRDLQLLNLPKGLIGDVEN